MNASTRRAGIAVGAAATLGLGSWLLAPPAPAAAVAPLAAVTSVAARPAGTAAPARGAVMPAAKKEPQAEPSRELALPDGSRVPALNGAADPAPLADYWGPFPWSPIVATRSSNGVDWYEHADGSMSTTMMVWARGLNRHVCMTRVAHPGPAPAATATH